MKYCLSCGRPLVEITTKTAAYKGVCLNCEMTYKVMEEGVDKDQMILKTSTPSQITEAAINRKKVI